METVYYSIYCIMNNMYNQSEFQSVINTRYKAPLLSKVWSPDNRVKTMRQLWIDLAIEQKNLGITSISEEAIQELILNRDTIDYEKINEYEKRLKHDIMAHIHAYSELCPNGGSILHLGATSNFINDNADAILLKQSIQVLFEKTNHLIEIMSTYKNKYAEVPTIAYTHLQPAQLITIGRRFAMWIEDLHMDLQFLQKADIPFRGVKGTVGTEDTLLKLFRGDSTKCSQLNEKISSKYDFKNYVQICGQTYSRKYDVEIMHCISGVGQTIYKIMNDLRLLSGKKEVYEDFSEEQVGSSAMPYKKNPITCEKICSLCRHVINQEQSIVQTYMNQWLERSLDDSAIKRIVFPECFLIMEHILNESIKIFSKLFFDLNYIETQVQAHMVNIVSEEIILKGVESGYSRQEIHERLRKLLVVPITTIDSSKPYDIFMKDPIIMDIITRFSIGFNPADYIGRSVEQCNYRYCSPLSSLLGNT